jgi:hypothetical protein
MKLPFTSGLAMKDTIDRVSGTFCGLTGLRRLSGLLHPGVTGDDGRYTSLHPGRDDAPGRVLSGGNGTVCLPVTQGAFNG